MDVSKQPAPTRSRPRYRVAQKLDIVRFARSNSARAACQRFHVARSSIYLWTAQEGELLQYLHGQLRRHQRGGNANGTTSRVDVRDTTTLMLQEVVAERLDNDETPHAARLPTCSSEDGVVAPNESEISITATGELHSRSTDARLTIEQSEIATVTASEREDSTGSVLVGYQGADGRFTNVAARRTFMQLISTRASLIRTFELTCYPLSSHALDALHKQEVDFAFIATDVLLSNTNHAALDQMVASRLKMIGEVVLQDVDICALPGTELCDVDCVVSDWSTLQRYEQYIVYLEKQYNRKINREVTWDSAAGCRLIQEERAENTVVLCTTSAATAHGLVVLQGRLPGSPTHTRCTVLGRHTTNPLPFEDIERPPTSIQMTTRCTLLIKGTARPILDIISAFAYRGLEIVSFHTRGDEEQQLYGTSHSYSGGGDKTNICLTVYIGDRTLSRTDQARIR